MKRTLVLVSAATIAALALAGCSSSAGESTSSPTTKTTAKASAAADKSGKQTDGDWTLESYKLKDNGLGDFGGTVRITYNGDDESGGTNIFTLTIFKKGEQVGTAMASLTEAAPGKTKTADLVSTDKFVKGPYTVEFQKDL